MYSYEPSENETYSLPCKLEFYILVSIKIKLRKPINACMLQESRTNFRAHLRIKYRLVKICYVLVDMYNVSQ